MKKTVRIRVTGKVQGVFYRQSTKETAKALGITGEVRNEDDGTVTVIATGTNEQIQRLADWCKIGPRKAVVESVDMDEEELKEFSDFRIVR